MRISEVADMDIIAHPGAVRRVIVGAIYRYMAALPHRRFHRDLDEVGGARSRLAGAALRVGARDIEVAERAVIDRVRSRDIGEHPLRHELGPAIRINGLRRRGFRDRDLLGDAVSGSGRGKDEMPHASMDGALEKRPAFGCVVMIIFKRILDGFGNHNRAGEVHDCLDSVVGKQLPYKRFVRDVALDELGPRRNGPLEPCRQIVEDNHIPISLKKGENSVATDIARASGHKHVSL